MLEPETSTTDWRAELDSALDEWSGVTPPAPAPVVGTPTPASTEAPASPTPASDAPSTPEPATEPAPTSAPPEPAPDTPTSDDEPAPTATDSFTFRADGKDITIPGAKQYGTGRVTFTKEGFAALQRDYIAHREGINQRLGSLKQREEAARQQVETLRQQRSAGEVKANLLTDKILEARNAGPEAFATLMQSLYDELPTLLARAEADHWKREAERATTPPPPNWEQAEPTFWPALRDAFDGELAKPEFAVLKDKADEVFAELQEIGRADGLVGFNDQGQPVYDEKAFYRELRRMAKVEATLATERKRMADERALLARNQAALTTPKPKAPAVVPATAPSATTAPTTQTPVSRKDWRASMEDDDSFRRSLEG